MKAPDIDKYWSIRGRTSLRLLAEDLVILDKNGHALTDEAIRLAGMTLQESAIFRVLVLGESETKGTKKFRPASKAQATGGKLRSG